MAIITELFEEIQSTIKYRNDILRWQKKYDKQAPRAGDLAPDFTLSDITGEKTVTLSEFQGKRPVVLVFGSFT